MSDTAELILSLIVGLCAIATVFYYSFACFYALFMNISDKIRGSSSKLIPCYVCGHAVSQTAIICPSCGESFGRDSESSIAESIFAMLVLGVLTSAIGVYFIMLMIEPVKELYILFK